jgi:hypothetical protein
MDLNQGNVCRCSTAICIQHGLKFRHKSPVQFVLFVFRVCVLLVLLQGYLSYAEGCYSGIRTLEAPNLWTPLDSLSQVKVPFKWQYEQKVFLFYMYIYRPRA